MIMIILYDYLHYLFVILLFLSHFQITLPTSFQGLFSITILIDEGHCIQIIGLIALVEFFIGYWILKTGHYFHIAPFYF